MNAPVVDARNLMCPLPVIRTQQRIESLRHRDELIVLATDPGALHDIPAWCRVHGHEVIDQSESEGQICIHIRVLRDAQ